MTRYAILACGIAIASFMTQAAPALDLRFSHTSPTNTINHRAFEFLAAEVDKETKGDIKIRILPNAQLGGEKDQIEGLLLGTSHGAMPSVAVLANFVPELNVLNMPFLFRDLDHFEKVWSGPFFERASGFASAKGIRLLCGATTGLRNLMSKKPIFGMEDMKGMKIRSVQNPIYIASFNAFGALAAAIPYPELYQALQSGVVDGADAANQNYYDERFYEPAPYWAVVNWSIFSNPFIMSEKSFQALSPDNRKAMLAAGKRTCDYTNTAYREDTAKALFDLQQKGVKVTLPNPVPFRDASKKVYEQFLTTDTLKQLMAMVLETK